MSKADNGRDEPQGLSVPARRYQQVAGASAWGSLPRFPRVPDPGGQAGEPGDADYDNLWGVLRRRRGTVVLVFLLTVFVAGAWVVTTRPVYTATGTLRVDKDEPRVLTFEEVVKQTDPLPDTLQTYQRLLQSRTLANRVIRMLSLGTHPDFQDQAESQPWIGRARTWVRGLLAAWSPQPPASDPGAAGDLAVESPLTQVFQGRLSVEPVRGSRLVAVSFDSHDPVLAARVANALSDTFVVQTHEFRADTGRYASGFLSKQMAETRTRLESAEEKLNAFLKANGINFVSPATLMGRGGGGTERQDLITQQLGTLSDALLKARGDRIGKESLVQQAQNSNIEALPAVLQSSLMVKLKEELGTLEAERQRLAQTFRPEYPRMQQIQQSIDERKGQIRAEIQRIISALKTDYQAALQNERQIEGQMNQQRAEALKLGDKMVEYNILRRDVDAGRELYTSLLTRLKESQISADLLTSPISIVDRADIPLQPSRPRKALVMLLASLVGLLGGVGLAFISDRRDRRLTNVEGVERLFGVPALGLVPRVGRFGGSSARRYRLHGGRPPVALVTHLESASRFAESCRNLRTNLLYSTPDGPPRTVMVTSLEAGDGKTALAMNLAVSLARLGSGEVLLVDGDLRHPELHMILNVQRSPGLSTFLTGEADLSEVIRPSDVANLSVIPGGGRPDNPGDLLASRRLGQALEELTERFEHIIFDAPPLLGVSDALSLAPRLDGVVLVLRHGRANRDDAEDAIQRLCVVRANLLGVVMNGVEDGARGRRYAYDGARR
jgi:succinoglycan biosynthesis transport protein ExoP